MQMSIQNNSLQTDSRHDKPRRDDRASMYSPFSSPPQTVSFSHSDRSVSCRHERKNPAIAEPSWVDSLVFVRSLQPAIVLIAFGSSTTAGLFSTRRVDRMLGSHFTSNS